MLFNPYSLFFLSSVIISTFIALSSMQWLIIWVALEMNMMSFVPLFMLSKSVQATESSIKYFLAQALGSIILLFCFTNNLSFSLVMLGFMLKAGMAPLHYWFPQVVSGVNWVVMLMLLTWQKVIPLMFLMLNMESMNKELLCILGMINSIVGGVGGLNQTALRPLLAYSSIGHMGWMIISSMSANSLFFFYFFIYVLINLSVVGVLMVTHMRSISFMSIGKEAMLFISLVVSLMSLGGLPPLLGFFPKMMVLMTVNLFGLSMIMIMGSLMNLIYYFNISFSVYLSSGNMLLEDYKMSFWGSFSILFYVFVLNFVMPLIIFF